MTGELVIQAERMVVDRSTLIPDLDNPNVGRLNEIQRELRIGNGVPFISFRRILMVKINGECLDIAGKTVREFLLEAEYSLSRVAVELNGEILPKSGYDYKFADGDVVEVVGLVGGG